MKNEKRSPYATFHDQICNNKTYVNAIQTSFDPTAHALDAAATGRTARYSLMVSKGYTLYPSLLSLLSPVLSWLVWLLLRLLTLVSRFLLLSSRSSGESPAARSAIADERH